MEEGAATIFAYRMSIARNNDRVLIERFEKIYFSTRDQLIAFVRKNTIKKETVEDVVQECYIVLWDKLGSLEDDERVINLLRTIAKRTIIDNLRKASREYIRAGVFYEALDNGSFTEDDLHIKEMMQDYARAVNALPPKRRQIYKLVKEEGLSHKQIAEQLHISTHTIERHINEAMRTLRTRFAADKIMFALILLRIGM